METLIDLAALVALSAPVALVAAFAVARGPEVMGQAFAAHRPDGWPRGVQEEDPSFDTTWRLRAGVERDVRAEADAPLPPVSAVAGTVRRRGQPAAASRSPARR